MQNGTYKNATPPFGFKKVNGDLEIEENQALIVRQIFEWYISGYGLKAIADMLNGMNLSSSKQAVLWKADNIRYITPHPDYTLFYRHSLLKIEVLVLWNNSHKAGKIKTILKENPKC